MTKPSSSAVSDMCSFGSCFRGKAWRVVPDVMVNSPCLVCGWLCMQVVKTNGGVDSVTDYFGVLVRDFPLHIIL